MDNTPEEDIPEDIITDADDDRDGVPDPGDLKPMTQRDLNDAIKKHAMYMRGQIGGARAVIQYRNLSNLDFKGANLEGADFTGSMLLQVDLSNCNLASANFFACDLRNSNFKNANCARADMRGAYVAGTDFTGADLTKADMREGKIMKRDKFGFLEDRKRAAGEGARTIFTGAKLKETNMSGVQAFAADFSDADLSGTNLNHADLSGANFDGANLTDADLTYSDLTDTTMRSAIIAGASMANIEKAGLDLTGAISEKDMGDKLENLGKTLPELLEEHTIWVATAGKRGRQLDLSKYDLREVIDLRRFPLTAIIAKDATFLNQDLSAAELQGACFDRSDFRDCRMVEADLRGSSLKYAKMARADLTEALLCPLEFHRDNPLNRLKRVDLSGADLRFARLSEADLRDCVLMGADLTNAVLRGADLRRADLTGAILKGADLDGARLDDAVIDMSTV